MKTSIIFLLAISFTSWSQESPIKFGVIPLEDMKMTVYDKDSSAAAVVLADFGKVEMSEFLETSFKRHTRIKILTKEGLSWANVTFLTSHGDGVRNLQASTYNLENGRMVETKLTKDGIFLERFNKYYDRQKFTMPNVKAGSVIEYSYNAPEGIANLPNWQFQLRIPTRVSEYWATHSDLLVFEKYMQGYVSAFFEKKDKQFGTTHFTVYHLLCKDVPAFKSEPFMTGEADYISKINFSIEDINIATIRDIGGSWENHCKVLLKHEDFGSIISQSGFLKTETEAVIKGITDPEKIVEAVYSYVRNNMEWDGSKDYWAYEIKRAIERKKGSSSNINLMLASMLKKAGIPVEMVLVSTRDNGFIRKEYPMLSQINYVICSARVGDKTLLLDATEKYLPAGVLPERCLNSQGLVVAEGPARWVDLQSKAKAKTVVNADLNLDGSGELSGTVGFIRDGYDARKMRTEFHSKGEETYVKDYRAKKSWDISKTSFSDVEDLSKPAREIHEVVVKEQATQGGDVLYVSPIIALNLPENPFRQTERMFPVSFESPIEQMYICKINLPADYVVDELPQSKIIVLPGNSARYTYSATQTGNAISLTSNFQINRTLFTQDEYPRLKEFYNQVVAKQAEQIVLKKKK